ncbi:GFA family protein [Pseudoduganella sp. GCM10020061]|uniref:GFA family protein n=1 Tax=Pseudoduganella sp. GCM10020061 TaxID=3317345 RepID=UPI0036328857
MLAQGGCYCGAVRYEVRGELTHATMCHCADCRRVAGAPAVAWVTVAEERLQFTDAQPRWFRSSEHVLRAFCAACGTPIAYKDEREAGFVDVVTCSLDDPAIAAPEDHTFYASRVPWLHVCDDLPRFARTRRD